MGSSRIRPGDDPGLSFACVRSLLDAHPAVRRLWVGYSGGVDSHVLLHLLARHGGELGGRRLAAVHVDHGLQPASAAWGRHCQAVCRDLGVDLRLLRVDARPAPGESPEAAARRARYRALEDLIGEGDALLTAHHRDDQAETVLLQLLRGAGPHGLAGMPATAALGQGLLLRPLLEVGRAEILAYARSQGLAWVDDASNDDRRLPRNYLRHEVLPRLKAREPAAARRLARSARLLAEAAALADALADLDLAAAATGRPDCLDVHVLRALDPARQRNALRRWLRRLRLPAPQAVHLHHILSDAIAAPRDRKPCVHWPGGELRRYRDRLYAMAPLPSHDPARTVSWTLGASGWPPLSIAGIGLLCLRPAVGEGLRAAALAGAPLTVRFRQGGERFRPQGRRHGQALKKLLQEAEVPPWERERLPLLYVGERLAAVAELWVGADVAARAGEGGLRLEWQKEPPSGTL